MEPERSVSISVLSSFCLFVLPKYSLIASWTLRCQCLKKKKVFSPFPLWKKLYIPLIFLWKHLGHCPFYGFLTLLRYFMPLWVGVLKTPILWCKSLTSHPSQETEFWESLHWDSYFICSLGLGNNLNLIWVKYLI